ncbi:hypothetical protein FA95DRAFT_1557489 [Auriscalpium vulgare]|uniref:Uncharacterized protein n=1 Tax=Auriscalpium vulgare TaxID=40419 RepID=A0ACB8RZC3_9AGAM|nr:hypothetical protein FA95DRAFT_1557489 [Auriscalpium vulgare]
MSSFKFLPTLKRQPAVRNRTASRTKASTITSKGQPHLPALPELAEEEDVFTSSCASSRSPSPAQLATRPGGTTKRMSRYGQSEFALNQDIVLNDDFLSAAPRPAPRPPIVCQPAPEPRRSRSARRKTVRLSAFDIRLDFDTSDSEPSSSTTASSSPLTPFTPPRARSPTLSISSNFTTSTSGSSSGCMPTTPNSSDDSDDEWGAFPRPGKVQRVSIRPLVITKASPPHASSPVETFEFTIAPSIEEEDDAAWYSREMSDVFTLSSSNSPTAPARRDSLPLPALTSGPRSRFSKPLPAPPRSPGPSAQLDPMFPRRARVIPPLPTRPPPPPPASPPRRKSLTITVPRPPPRMSLPADVADILDDIDAWGASPDEQHAASAPPLSPPRLPESPHSATDDLFEQYMYTPGLPLIEIAPESPPAPSLPALALPDSPLVLPDTPLARMYDARADEELDVAGDADSGFEPMLRSRWSSSTLASEYAVPASAASRVKFHLGEMARRVVTRRESKGGATPMPSPPALGALSKENVERRMNPRMSMESLSSRDSGDSSSSSGLRRKPIPLEIFLRA